jgi:hypothetical protein
VAPRRGGRAHARSGLDLAETPHAIRQALENVDAHADTRMHECRLEDRRHSGIRNQRARTRDRLAVAARLLIDQDPAGEERVGVAADLGPERDPWLAGAIGLSGELRPKHTEPESTRTLQPGEASGFAEQSAPYSPARRGRRRQPPLQAPFPGVVLVSPTVPSHVTPAA